MDSAGPSEPSLRWYLLYTKPKHEDQVASRLSQAGYEVLNPKLEERRFYRGKPQNVIAPLFPRYLFVRLDYGQDFRNAKYTRGVVHIVGTSQAPTVVDDSIIETIRSRLLEDGRAILPAPELRPGDEVEIHGGPFAGLTGIFVKPMKGVERVSVLLKAIHARVEVDVAYLSPNG